MEKCLAEARLVQGHFGEKKKRRGCFIGTGCFYKRTFSHFGTLAEDANEMIDCPSGAEGGFGYGEGQ